MTKTPQQRHIHRKLKLFWKAPENTPHKALEVLIYVSNIHYKMGPFTHIIQIYNPFEWPYKQVTIPVEPHEAVAEVSRIGNV